MAQMDYAGLVTLRDLDKRVARSISA